MKKKVDHHHLYTDEADGEKIFIKPGVPYVHVYFVSIISSISFSLSQSIRHE